MDIQLIQGQFSGKDALDIITQMVQIKIRFQESKISHLSNEEDIKVREKKIQALQNELHKVRNYLADTGRQLSVHSEINLSNADV
jgi:hypothetical protein